MSTYAAATNTFQLQYNSLPGDFDGVEDYGMHQNEEGTTTACRTDDGSGESYNGNDDGFINSKDGTNPRYSGEMMNFFVTLSNAEFIKERFAREGDANCNYTHYEGQSYPETEIDGGMIVLSDYFAGELFQYFVLGGMGTSHSNPIDDVEEDSDGIAGNYLTPKVAYRIDEKLDNKNPLTGFVRVITQYDGTSDSSSMGSFIVDATDDVANCVYNSEYNRELVDEVCTLAVQMRY